MNNQIEEKSFAFAIRIVNLYKYLWEEKHEHVMSNQLLRSGTSIGANVSEAQHGQSKRDFTAKMNIALKEAGETSYWIRLLHSTDYIDNSQFYSIFADADEIHRLLSAICKTLNENNE